MTERTSAERRIAAVEARLETIDQRGTRGMEGVRAQLGGVQRDLGKVESVVDRIETSVSGLQLQISTLKPARPWPAIVAYAGILLPMYALVIDLIATRR